MHRETQAVPLSVIERSSHHPRASPSHLSPPSSICEQSQLWPTCWKGTSAASPPELLSAILSSTTVATSLPSFSHVSSWHSSNHCVLARLLASSTHAVPANQLGFWALGSAGPFFEPQAVLKSSWIHVRITSNQPRMPGNSRLLHKCFHLCLLSRRPFPNAKKKYGKDPHTSSDSLPRLGDPPFIPKDGHNSSFFFVDDCSQIAVDCYKNFSRHLFLSSHIELKEDVQGTFVRSLYFCSVLHAEPLNRMQFAASDGFSMSLLFLPPPIFETLFLLPLCLLQLSFSVLNIIRSRTHHSEIPHNHEDEEQPAFRFTLSSFSSFSHISSHLSFLFFFCLLPSLATPTFAAPFLFSLSFLLFFLLCFSFSDFSSMSLLLLFFSLHLSDFRPSLSLLCDCSSCGVCHTISASSQHNSLKKTAPKEVIGSSSWLFPSRVIGSLLLRLKVLGPFPWLFLFLSDLCQWTTPPIHGNPSLAVTEILPSLLTYLLVLFWLPASVVLSSSWRTELIPIAFPVLFLEAKQDQQQKQPGTLHYGLPALEADAYLANLSESRFWIFDTWLSPTHWFQKRGSTTPFDHNGCVCQKLALTHLTSLASVTDNHRSHSSTKKLLRETWCGHTTHRKESELKHKQGKQQTNTNSPTWKSQ